MKSSRDTILSNISNPSSHWDDYRSLLSSIPPEIKALMKEKIMEALISGCSIRQLSYLLDDISPLSHEEHETIAWTELARVQVTDSFAVYKYSEVVSGKSWLIASDANCPLCLKNASVGSIGLDDLFPSGDYAPPAHPRCRCDILPVTKIEEIPKQGSWIMKMLGKLLPLILLIVWLAGCVSSGRKIDQSAADKIEKGITTRDQVINLIGSPDRITRTGNGDTIYMYNYMRIAAKPASFIPYVGLFVGGSNLQHQMYMVTFGPDGVVKDYLSTYGASESDRGLATGSKAEMPDVEMGKREK
jgi:outer membrane protein assembly factor BamE (lipoprotein component of BamABCDE complex)